MQSWQIKIKVQVSESKYAQTLQYSNHILHHYLEPALSGGDLKLHLEKLVEAEYVQEFIKKNHFEQETITEPSESWEFCTEATHADKYAYKNYCREERIVARS
ncbi:hypothetical protein YC2023_099271 [Brassica napus]